MQQKKEKQIQISESSFINLYKLLIELNKYDLDNYTLKLKNELEGQIQAKFDAIEKRKLYTAYKTSSINTIEREDKRKEYLKKAKINKNWQTEKEIHLY